MPVVHYKLKDELQAPPAFYIPVKHGRSYKLLLMDVDGVRREARYCDNEESIFVKDQNKKSRPTKIKFINGNLSFDNERNPVLEKFLDAHPANGKTFIKVDLVDEAKKKVEMEELITEAKFLIKKSTNSEIEHLAKVFMPTAENLSVEEMKAHLYNVATVNAESIIQNLSTDEAKKATEVESLAKQAFDKEIVYQTENKQHINWSDTDEPILKKSHMKGAEKALNEFLADPENVEVTNEIKRRLGA